MRKRIQKYRNSGVLTGGSNLTPPLPQPPSLLSSNSDYFNKMKSFSGSNIESPQIVTNSFTTPIMKDYASEFSKSAEQIMAPINNLIDFNAKMGDPLSMSLKFNRDSNKAMQDMKKFGGTSSTVNPGSGLFSKAKIGNTMSVAGGIADIAGSLIPKKEQSALTEGLNQGYDAAANAAMAIPGVGTIIGGAMKVGGLLSDGLTAMGVGTDQMTGVDKVLDSKFLKLTPLGLVNAIGAKKADTITKDNEAFEQVGSSYGGTQATVDDALTKSGKKYGLLSGGARNKANRQIHNAQMQQSKMGNIADEAQMAFTASNNPLLGLGTQLQLNGGYQQNTVRAGKSGLKMDKDFAKRVVKLSKGQKEKRKKIQEEARMEEVAGFKNGGAVNVIPDGALHAHKHHLENVDEKFEEVTTKGIPVITEEKGGDIKQHAEVEREEIIFNLDVTKQLEKLMQDGSDEAAIEAGKLLVHEILENTVDNTGLLNTVE
nr:MAG TPA: hypothetical protein [Caudoviricetes sp.]